MVVLLGVLLTVGLVLVALAVDSGRLVQERFQLQDGADAGALAIALDCAAIGCPGDPAGVANGYLAANSDPRTGAGGAAVAINGDAVSGSVRVEARNPTLPLSGAQGADSVSVGAAGVAVWGPSGTGATAPLGFADCVIGGPPPFGGSPQVTVRVRQRGVDRSTPLCDDDEGAGAAVLRHSACEVESSAIDRDWLRQAPNGGPNGLSTIRSECGLRRGDRVPVVIFDDVCTGGSSCPGNESYRVAGYAFFEIEAFLDCDIEAEDDDDEDLPGECIRGHFFPGVLTGQPIGGEPFGASTVRLEQ